MNKANDQKTRKQTNYSVIQLKQLQECLNLKESQ